MAYEMILAPVTVANARNSEAAAIEVKGGRILLAWSDFYGGPTDYSAGRVSGVISSDGGRTWGEKFTMVENTAVINTMMPSLLRLQSGELALFYLKQEDLGDSRMFIRKSHDEGETWGDEVCVTSDVGYHGPANDRVIQLRSGRIVLPDSVNKTTFPDGDVSRLRSYYSDDNGETWHQGAGDALLPPVGGGEPVAVERKDGSLLMVIRTPLAHLYRCESFDEGDTWSVPVPMALVTATSPPMMKRIPSTGDLLLVWNHSLDGRRNPLTATISKDDGETWSNVRDLEDDAQHSVAYPSITFVGDEVLLTYYRSKYERTGWELKLKILPVSWFYE